MMRGLFMNKIIALTPDEPSGCFRIFRRKVYPLGESWQDFRSLKSWAFYKACLPVICEKYEKSAHILADKFASGNSKKWLSFYKQGIRLNKKIDTALHKALSKSPQFISFESHKNKLNTLKSIILKLENDGKREGGTHYQTLQALTQKMSTLEKQGDDFLLTPETYIKTVNTYESELKQLQAIFQQIDQNRKRILTQFQSTANAHLSFARVFQEPCQAILDQCQVITQHVIGHFNTIGLTDLLHQETELKQLTDSLTETVNSSKEKERYDSFLSEANRYAAYLSLLKMPRFKELNDLIQGFILSLKKQDLTITEYGHAHQKVFSTSNIDRFRALETEYTHFCTVNEDLNRLDADRQSGLMSGDPALLTQLNQVFKFKDSYLKGEISLEELQSKVSAFNTEMDAWDKTRSQSLELLSKRIRLIENCSRLFQLTPLEMRISDANWAQMKKAQADLEKRRIAAITCPTDFAPLPTASETPYNQFLKISREVSSALEAWHNKWRASFTEKFRDGSQEFQDAISLSEKIKLCDFQSWKSLQSDYIKFRKLLTQCNQSMGIFILEQVYAPKIHALLEKKSDCVTWSNHIEAPARGILEGISKRTITLEYAVQTWDIIVKNFDLLTNSLEGCGFKEIMACSDLLTTYMPSEFAKFQEDLAMAIRNEPGPFRPLVGNKTTIFGIVAGRNNYVYMSPQTSTIRENFRRTIESRLGINIFDNDQIVSGCLNERCETKDAIYLDYNMARLHFFSLFNQAVKNPKSYPSIKKRFDQWQEKMKQFWDFLGINTSDITFRFNRYLESAFSASAIKIMQLSQHGPYERIDYDRRRGEYSTQKNKSKIAVFGPIPTTFDVYIDGKVSDQKSRVPKDERLVTRKIFLNGAIYKTETVPESSGLSDLHWRSETEREPKYFTAFDMDSGPYQVLEKHRDITYIYDEKDKEVDKKVGDWVENPDAKRHKRHNRNDFVMGYGFK
jgi:hypothetical protein